MANKNDVVIVSACRTALGVFNGGLSGMPAVELGAAAITEAIRRAGINKELVDQAIMSQVLPCGCGQNPGRLAAVKAGLKWETDCITVNKVCGGGLKAVMLASQSIKCGDSEITVAGGMENMSQAPYYMEKARFGARMGNSPLLDHMMHDGLWDVVNDFHMGSSNDLIAKDYNISREDQDMYAAMSYERATKSVSENRFAEEIFPIETPGKKGQVNVFSKDEGPKETSYETLSKMRPAFNKDGTATAGNASIIADGASAVCVMSRAKADELGINPIASIVGYASSGLDMKYVLIAPIKSIPKAIDKTGLKLSDIDLHEINEAFAGSTVCVMRELGLSKETVNVNGGSVALGHPIGASGARVLTTLLFEMKKRNAALGQASLCLGGGEGVTMIVRLEN